MCDAAGALPAAAGAGRWRLLLVIVVIALLPLLLRGAYWRTNLVVCAINVLLALGLE